MINNYNLQVKSSKDKKAGSKSSSATTNSISSSTTGKKTLGLPSLPTSSSSSGTSEEDDSDDDLSSLAGTETTETTLVDRNENELQVCNFILLCLNYRFPPDSVLVLTSNNSLSFLSVDMLIFCPS